VRVKIMKFINKISIFLIIILYLIFGTGPGSISEMLRENEISAQSGKNPYFRIQITDSETGRGIPMVELKTTNNITYYTDSAGYIAFYEPGYMDQDVFFHISSHGYQFPNESFGFRGQTISVRSGSSVTLKMDRINIARRLYRLTGQGIYRDSQMLGLDVPIEDPVINARVMGSDSTHAIIYRDSIFWLWGDTVGPFHPLGNFRTSSATSKLPENGGISPDIGVDYTYFTRDDGFTKQMVPQLPGDPNLAWLSTLMTTKDERGNERLIASYAMVHGLTAPEEVGIVLYNHEKQIFDERYPFDTKDEWRYPGGTSTYIEQDGQGYWVFMFPFPSLRVRDNLEDIKQMEKYEAFTCLEEGTEFNGRNTKVARDNDGKLVWEWKKNTQYLTQDQEKQLIQYGIIKREEARYQLKDVKTGKGVTSHRGTIKWNNYTKSWVKVFCEIGGSTSFLGEIWYAKSENYTGPWNNAIKIVTHNKYGFYNPIHHQFFDQNSGQYIYFEGTYTTMFDGSPHTPWYEYNQIMYQLDLGDPRLDIPLGEFTDKDRESTPISSNHENSESSNSDNISGSYSDIDQTSGRETDFSSKTDDDEEKSQSSVETDNLSGISKYLSDDESRDDEKSGTNSYWIIISLLVVLALGGLTIYIIKREKTVIPGGSEN